MCIRDSPAEEVAKDVEEKAVTKRVKKKKSTAANGDADEVLEKDGQDEEAEAKPKRKKKKRQVLLDDPVGEAET